jgi:hypothetical protein
MSKQYTADGKRKSSMVHATHPWTCECGRTVMGNGGKSGHQRACRVWLEHWLGSLEKMLAREGEGALPSSVRWRWETDRDETRARLEALNQRR